MEKEKIKGLFQLKMTIDELSFEFQYPLFGFFSDLDNCWVPLEFSDLF